MSLMDERWWTAGKPEVGKAGKWWHCWETVSWWLWPGPKTVGFDLRWFWKRGERGAFTFSRLAASPSAQRHHRDCGLLRWRTSRPPGGTEGDRSQSASRGSSQRAGDLRSPSPRNREPGSG